MCTGGGSKESSPAPLPPPAPVPTPSDVAPQQTAEQRAKTVSSLRYGVMSTIKTGPQGITGAGPDLNIAAAQGQMKNKLGQ